MSANCRSLVWLRNRPRFNMLRQCGVVPYSVGVTLGPKRLANLVRESGLEVVQTRAILHGPRVLAVWRARRLRGQSVAAPFSSSGSPSADSCSRAQRASWSSESGWSSADSSILAQC